MPFLKIATSPLRDRALFLLVAISCLVWRVITIDASDITLYVDEAQYWAWSKDIQWGYFSKPPGIAVLIAASTSLFGDGVIGSKLLAMLCYPLSALLAHRIALHVYGPVAALWSAILVLTLPIYAWLGLFTTTDALLVLCWTAASLLYLKALDENRYWQWITLGLVCGLGLLSKYTMLAWLAGAFLHLMLMDRRRLLTPQPWLAVSIALGLLAPNIAWNVAHDFPTFKHTVEITVHRQAGGAGSLLEFIASQWIAIGPLLGIALIPAIISGRKLPENTFQHQALLCFSLPLWLIAGLQAAGGSANANWAAPAFIPATIIITGWLVCRQYRQWLFGGLAINLLLTALVYHWPTISQATYPGAPTPYSRALGWSQLASQLRPLFAQHPDALLIADNRTILAHMQYELRDIHPRVASWNPAGTRNDHYQLSTHLEDHPGCDALILSTGALAPDIARGFASVTGLGSISAATGGAGHRQFEVYLLNGFKAY